MKRRRLRASPMHPVVGEPRCQSGQNGQQDVPDVLKDERVRGEVFVVGHGGYGQDQVLGEPRPHVVGTVAEEADPSTVSPGEKQYTLAMAFEVGIVPWKSATMRQYLLRSQQRGVPVPAATWDGRSNLYTEAQLREWLAAWALVAGPESKIHQQHDGRAGRVQLPHDEAPA